MIQVRPETPVKPEIEDTALIEASDSPSPWSSWTKDDVLLQIECLCFVKLVDLLDLVDLTDVTDKVSGTGF